MNDSAQSKTIICPADKDPAVRLLIATGLCVAGAVYCIVDADPKPDVPLATKAINEYAKYWLSVYGPWVLGAAAAFLAGYAVTVLRRLIVADEEGLTINRSRRYAWSQFTGLNASKLKDKGLLTLMTAGGGEVVLDRYKYKNFKELVALVDRKVSASSAGSTQATRGGEG